MNLTEKQLMNCLAAYCTGKPEAEYVGGFSGEDWKRLYQLAQIHKLVPVMFEVLRGIPDFCKDAPELQNRWKQETLLLSVGQAVRSRRIIEISGRLHREHIPCALLKGLICRELYTRPDLRISGDEDLFIRESDRETCGEILKSMGLFCVQEESGVTHWQDPPTALNIELHTCMFSEKREEWRKMNRIFAEQLDHLVPVRVTDGEVWSFPPQYHMLLLICHALKHFTVAGFGVRTLCDMVAFADRYHAEIAPEKLEKILDEIHGRVFFDQILQIGEEYLETDLLQYGWSCSAPPDGAELLEDCLEGGVYGKSTESRTHSAGLVSRAVEEGTAKVSVRKNLFPGRDKMERRYPVLKKHPVLLPACWIHRICRYGLEIIRGNSNNSPSESMKIGEKRIEMMKKYEVYQKNQA